MQAGIPIVLNPGVKQLDFDITADPSGMTMPQMYGILDKNMVVIQYH